MHHYLQLPGARVVATDRLLDVRELVKDIVELQAIGAIHGPAGTGKTFAVDQALEKQPAQDCVLTTFRSRPTTRFVRHELYSALGLGVSPPISPVETDRYLKEALSERFRLVVIDEAQWLNRECCEYLRHLWDDRATRFALLFIGGAGCFEVLRREPMLSSRIYAQVRFAPLTPAQVAKVIPIYHEIYAAASADLIELVDSNFAHGNFREWAKFTQHAGRLLKELNREHLNEEVARNVFERLSDAQSDRLPRTELAPMAQCRLAPSACCSMSATT
jgi:DNA transposition AAA+ family ATPase